MEELESVIDVRVAPGDTKRDAIISRLKHLKEGADKFSLRFHKLETIRNLITVLDVSFQTVAGSANAAYFLFENYTHLNTISLSLISTSLLLRSILMAANISYRIDDFRQKSMSLHAQYNSLNTKLLNNNLTNRDYDSINHELDLIENIISII